MRPRLLTGASGLALWLVPVLAFAQVASPGHVLPVMGPPDDHLTVIEREIADDDEDNGRTTIAVELPPETPAAVREAATSGAPVADFATALGLAYWTSPAILAQRAATRSADFRVPEARAAYGPKLDYQLMAGWQRDRNDPSALQRQLGQKNPSTSAGWSNSALAVLTMPLFTFGRNFAAERTAQAQRAYQKQVLRSTEQQAIFDAASAYAGLVRDRAGVTIARDNLTALQQELLDNQARLKAHEITVTDLEQIRSRVEVARAQMLSAQAQAASSEATFVQKIGARAAPELGPTGMLAVPAQTLEDAYAFAEAHSPVIMAAHERERVSRAAIAAAKADVMPRVDLKGQAIYASQSPYNNYARYNEELAQVVISGPIFESGQRLLRVSDAIAANDSDWRLIDGSLRDTRASVAAAWNDWKAQIAAIDHYAAAVVSAQKAYDGAVIQEREGLTTTFDVLQLALELLNARSNQNAAQAAAYIEAARIMALLGALDPDAIAPGSPGYDDTVHRDKVRHRGDIPLLTPVLHTVDGLVIPRNTRRAVRDPAVAIDVPTADLTPPPEPTVPGALPEHH